ncbi:hypothetical protein V1264_022863 [Littorina saxatilis]|uniref:Peptidase M1 membrane alanine aminopeptidase domain-containing protein n=2 Tax=Littorina saxatilis TaxID=31220 RepID=A0AAN9G9G5_9CAEN
MDDCEIPTPEQCKSVDQPAAGTGEIAENSSRVRGSVDVCHSCSNPDSVKSVDENVISSSEKKPSDSHHHMVCSDARDKYENIEMSHHSSQQPSGENSTDLDVRSTNQSCHVVAAEANVTAQTMFVNCSEVRSRCVPEESCVASQEQLSPCATIQHSAGLCHPSQHLESIKESRPFKMILDSYKLQIHKVEGMFLHGEEKLLFEKNLEEFLKKTSVKDFVFQNGYQWHMMDFVVKEHCILVSMETVHTVEQFPHAVRIWYQTCPESPSLMWTTDQDGNACVFTIGHFLSNRALFPSQDTPTALPTWHAIITVDGDLTTLLTGDREPLITVTDAGQKRFSYFTTFPMPSCTFAIAIGAWQTEVLSYPPFDYDPDQENLKEPTLRLFFPERLKERSTSVLSRYLPRCLLEAQRMLGTYPFHRLDVLIVPACFDSLGMASPSLLFLSQSLLCQDGSMCVRVAHELCHTWFGIVIGPHDWTEEWITEGFCTYLEDILHAKVSQLGEQTEDYIKVRAQIHLCVLKAELLNTDENLQSLRPNKGMADATERTSEQARYLKDGMNVEKKFMQVHYLKGYFLLQSLEREVGKVRFLAFLKSYVHRYIYQLVTSQDFLKMYFETFPDLT